MSYEQWLSCILGRVRAIASKEYQKETWKAGGNLVSSPSPIQASTHVRRTGGISLTFPASPRSRLPAVSLSTKLALSEAEGWDFATLLVPASGRERATDIAPAV